MRTNQPISTLSDKITGLVQLLVLAGPQVEGEPVATTTMRAVAMHELAKVAELAEIGQQAREWQEAAQRAGAITINTGAFAGEWVR